MTDKEFEQNRLERATVWEAKQKEMELEILAHPFITEKQDKYKDYELKGLAARIASRKVKAGIYGPDLVTRFEDMQLQHVEYGFELLQLILQKKLFNLQLEWRANRVTLPEIEISGDFGAYARDIFNCPFLESISGRELNVLKLYMQTFNFDTHVGWFGMADEWQDYDNLMEKNESGNRENMPDFYEFYDGQMGTFYLLDLPNERGESEDKFIQAGLKKVRLKNAARNKQQEENPGPTPKPHFYPDKDWQYHIFKEMEPEEFFVWKAALEEPIDYEENQYFEYINELANIADVDVCLPGWLTWDEGLGKALQNYKLAKAAEVLDLTYEQYLMKAEFNLFDTSETETRKKENPLREYIRKGMGLEGEEE